MSRSAGLLCRAFYQFSLFLSILFFCGSCRAPSIIFCVFDNACIRGVSLNCPHNEMKLKQNSLETVFKLF